MSGICYLEHFALKKHWNQENLITEFASLKTMALQKQSRTLCSFHFLAIGNKLIKRTHTRWYLICQKLSLLATGMVQH